MLTKGLSVDPAVFLFRIEPEEPDSTCGPINVPRVKTPKSSSRQIFIFPTGFARIIPGWLSKSGIPASARIAS